MDPQFEPVFVLVLLCVFAVTMEVFSEELAKLWDKIMEGFAGLK